MKFVSLFYVDRSIADTLSEAEGQEIHRANMAQDRALRASGHFVSTEALAEPRSAKTLRVRNGTPTVTDGPFAETKEHLAGFLVIEAADMDEAIEKLSADPMARLGAVEIRPVMDIDRSA
jgi:hypothetical protein